MYGNRRGYLQTNQKTKKMKTTKKAYLLFDSRWFYDGENAICLEYCETLKEAKESIDDYGDDTVIVEYDLDGDNLINPKQVI